MHVDGLWKSPAFVLSLVSASVINPGLYFRESPGYATVPVKADIVPQAISCSLLSALAENLFTLFGFLFHCIL